MNIKQHIENNISYFLLLGCLFSLFMHREHLHKDIQGSHLWRQSITMLNVQNFVRHDANILNPRVARHNNGDNLNRYEFPLMQWTIAMVLKVFGEHIIIVRLLMFLFSSLGTIGMYFLIAKITREKLVGLFTAALFQFSPVIFLYAINPLPDVLALSCVIWYVYWILEYRDNSSSSDLWKASFMLGLATLIKLPYLMFSVISMLFFVQDIIRNKTLRQKMVSFASVQFLLLIPALAWYAWVIPTWNGNPVVKGIFGGSMNWVETKRYLFFHVYDMFPKRLIHDIFWPFLIIGIIYFAKSKIRKDWILALLIITMIYLFFEFYAIADVHDYYMFPFLPLIFILIAYGVKATLSISEKWIPIFFIPFIILAGINIENIVQHSWSKERSQVNMDFYKYQDALKNAVPQNEKVIILNDFSNFLIPYIIDKQGNIFHDNNLPIEYIDDMIRRQKFRYMYSDSEIVNTRENFQPYIDSILLDAGTVQVYRLKLPTK